MKPLVLVGEALGDSELKLPGHPPLVGPSGAELIRMLSEAGVIELSSFDREYLHRYYAESNPAHIAAIWDLHPEVYRTNVFALHPTRNDLETLCGTKAEALPGYPALLKSKYLRSEYEPHLTRLSSDLMRLDPNLVVCLGNTPLWALTGSTGISKVRGTTMLSTHTVLDFKLLPTYHPAAVIRDWSLRPTTIADLMKAKRESAYAEIRRPIREIHIEPTLEEVAAYIRDFVLGSSLLSVDIETAANRITCIGFAPSPSTAIVIPFDDSRRKDGCYWPTALDERKCWALVRGVLENPSIPKLFHNGAYDVSFLWRAYGIKTMGCTHDSMLLSHALQPESLKSLGYLGSIFCDEHAWKIMRTKTETIKREN